MKFTTKIIVLIGTLILCLKDCHSSQHDHEHEECREELQRHLDINSVAADEGWYNVGNGYQYIKSDQNLTWDEARKYCEELDSQLAHIGIRDLNARGDIIEHVLGIPPNGNSSWIGLSRVDHTSPFKWLNEDEAARYSTYNENDCDVLRKLQLQNKDEVGFSTTEPNDSVVGEGHENCVHINQQNLNFWCSNSANDWPCSNKAVALCEKPVVIVRNPECPV